MTYDTTAAKQLVDNLRLNADKQIFGELVRLEDGECKLCAEGVAVITFAALAGYDYAIQQEGSANFYHLELMNSSDRFTRHASMGSNVSEFFFGNIPNFTLEYNGEPCTLMALNDIYKLSFDQIADIIEEQFINKGQ